MRIDVLYFSSLRDARGCERESLQTAAADASALFAQLRGEHGFALEQASLRVAINGEFASWEQSLQEGDEVAFIPPVSGG